MEKSKSLMFGNFLGKIRQKQAQLANKKITTTEIAQKVGLSQAHWHRAEKNGYILSLGKVLQVIERLSLDPVTAKILLAHAGYPNRHISLLDKASQNLANTQSIMAEIFYNPQTTGIIKSVVISWLDPELELPEYTRFLCDSWADIELGFTKEEIELFIQTRAQRIETYKEARIASQFIVLETILEKSAISSKKIMYRQIEHILNFMEENKFIEVRLLQPGPKCSIPMTNFRLYSNAYLWLGYMYYGEIVCGQMEPKLLRHFDNFFYEYWNKALSKEKTIKRLKELQKLYK